MEHLFFNDWQHLVRIAIVGVVSYAALILCLRAAGKRTLSRMNAYDMVVTMALGSVLTKAMLTQDQTISESVTAICLLVAFQYLLSVASCHWTWFRKWVVAEPAVLYAEGMFLGKAMKKERVTHTEIEAALHEKGFSNLSDVAAVILGSNGELNVLSNDRASGLHLSPCDDLPFRLTCEYPADVVCSEGTAQVTMNGPAGYDARLRVMIKDRTYPASVALLRAEDGDILPPAHPTGDELVYRVPADGRFEIRWQAL